MEKQQDYEILGYFVTNGIDTAFEIPNKYMNVENARFNLGDYFNTALRDALASHVPDLDIEFVEAKIAVVIARRKLLYHEKRLKNLEHNKETLEAEERA